MAAFLQVLPPACLVPVPGVGEMFVRDSGERAESRGTVLLLHGWMFAADLNWITCFGPLVEAGYRVVAVDHRGHGRGLRTLAPFRLQDCADDAAALLRHLGARPALVVGYSMGGAITQLMARRHRDVVAGIVLSATSLYWSGDRRSRVFWKAMGLLQLYLRTSSRRVWQRALKRRGMTMDDEVAVWLVTELERGDPAAIAEAGRELGRFDSRLWASELDLPTAVVCTTRDRLVLPVNQRLIADTIPGARLFEVAGDHTAVGMLPHLYVPALLEAVDDVRGRVAEAAGSPRAEGAA
ncbi:MAG TPA: alpha/beta fold hydrolase [Candidatus Dormibacteraeota bacterium]|jgi:3-oxoadipate enol-lactonase|nr:alpha/beta fold hydrolase [Candidatus Dormibacteraeota bacterium]